MLTTLDTKKARSDLSLSQLYVIIGVCFHQFGSPTLHTFWSALLWFPRSRSEGEPSRLERRISNIAHPVALYFFFVAFLVLVRVGGAAGVPVART